MIRGLTHDKDTGVLNAMSKYKGKISTGWKPFEGPNKKNAPMAAGFFRILKQVNIQKTLNGVKTVSQQWALNEPVQAELIKANNNSPQPRRIECMCFDSKPEQMWESYLGKFSDTEGLICKSNGEGTTPIQLVYEGDNRVRRERLFDGRAVCPYKDCPDFKKKLCKEIGVLKVYPMADLSINPYQFTTTSVNTIASIEYALQRMYMAAGVAHKLRCEQLGKKIEFDGLAGIRFTLVHRKIKSGGRDVFITQIEHSDDFSQYAMKTIQAGIENKQKLMLEGRVSEIVETNLIESDNEDGGEVMLETPALMSPEDEKEVAVDFDVNANKVENNDNNTLDAAAQALLKG